MQHFRTVLVGILCLGFAIADNCGDLGHDHASAASQQELSSSGYNSNGLQGVKTVSNIGSRVPLIGVTYDINANQNLGSGVYSRGSEFVSANQEFFDLGNVKSDVTNENIPYWWMNKPVVFQTGIVPLCGPNKDCNAGTVIKVNTVEQKMDLSKNPFLNGHFAAEVEKHSEHDFSSTGNSDSSKLVTETIGNRFNTNTNDKEISLIFNPFQGGAVASIPVLTQSQSHKNNGHNTNVHTSNTLTDINKHQHNGFGTVNTHGHNKHGHNSQSSLSSSHGETTGQVSLNGLTQHHDQFGIIDTHNHNHHHQQTDANNAQIIQNTHTSQNDLLNSQNTETKLNTNTLNANLVSGQNNVNKVEGSTNQKTEFSGNPFLVGGQGEYLGSASIISESPSTVNNNPLFNGIPQPTDSSGFVSEVISTINEGSRFGGESSSLSSSSNYGDVNVDRGYLPPFPATITCSGPNKVCAPPSLCESGVITDYLAAANSLNNKKQYCNVDSEVCCRVRVVQVQPPPPPPPSCSSTKGVNRICAPRLLCESGRISDLAVSANRLSSQNQYCNEVSEVCCRVIVTPPPPPPPPRPVCSGINRVCAPRSLCSSGAITDLLASANRLSGQNQYCNELNEVCCNVIITPPPPPPPRPICAGTNRLCAPRPLCSLGTITDLAVAGNGLSSQNQYCNEVNEVCCKVIITPFPRPPPPPPPRPVCSGVNRLCAPKPLCASGSITDIIASSNRLSSLNQYCDVQNEVCCKVIITPPPPPPPPRPVCSGPNRLCAPIPLCSSGSITDLIASSNRLNPLNQYCNEVNEVCCRVIITPPPPTPPPQVLCAGPNRLCAPKSLCALGTVSDLYAAEQRLSNQNQYCNVENEICCRVSITPTPTPIPDSSSRFSTEQPPPPPQTVACGAQNTKCVSPNQCVNGLISTAVSQQVLNQRPTVDKCYAPEVCCRIPVIPSREYLPQTEKPAKDNFGSSSNNNPNNILPPYKPTEPNLSGSSANQRPTIIRPTPGREVGGILPPVGCAAALKCTRPEFCTQQGTIAKSSVFLTLEQEIFRVPVTDCRNLEEGFTGKCCRDLDYTDPWPVGALGQYNPQIINAAFDDGSYRASSNNRGLYTPQKTQTINRGIYTPQTTVNRFGGTQTQVSFGSCQPVFRDRRSQPRGAGPIDTGFGEIPWQAMILLDTGRKLICGGSIIADDAVITTASCVSKYPPTEIMIKAGEWRLGVDEEPKTFQIVRVKTVSIEPRYKEGSSSYDVAILHLEDSLRFDTHIQPICIEDPLWAADSSDDECISTGWGKEVLKVHVKNALMHVINVTSLPESTCSANVGSDIYNKDGCFCGSPKADACLTDDGSGLACNIGNDYYFLRGVYVTENNCGDNANQFGVYAKIDINWVTAAFRNPGLNGLDYLDQFQTLGSSPVPVKRNFRSTPIRRF